MTPKLPFPDCCSEALKDWDLPRLFSELSTQKKKFNPRSRLTERQKEYICLLLCPKTLQEIAKQLHLEYGTVKQKCLEIYEDIYNLTGLETKTAPDVYINLDKAGYKQKQEANIKLHIEEIADQEIQDYINYINQKHGVNMTYKRINSGSIILVLEGSPGDCKKLEELFQSGELSEVAGIPVEDVWLGEKVTSRKRLTKLSQWLQDSREAVEETVKGFFYSLQDLELAPAGGAALGRRGYSTKAKIIDVSVQSVAFIITVALDPEDTNKTIVKLWLRPLDDDLYLPEGLKLTVLDEDDDEVDRVIADNTLYTELTIPPPDLKGKEGDRFIVTISLGDVIITESFEI